MWGIYGEHTGNMMGTHWNLDVNKLRTRWELGWNTKGTLILIK
jgi:hypothetical protein